ncbi:uncharacterized protein LOC125501906 [Athalia rosae]|uniref:uncharacterized protein LOC125501906 n=1 Tax=Athalia rosae TaxID=37344 RepID=UPI0020339A6C|nr:uncharacterized protein LOC125501906 [Athalia rosae]
MSDCADQGEATVEQEIANTSKNTSKISLTKRQLYGDNRNFFLSEPTLSIGGPNIAKKISSVPNIDIEVNYDDLCGKWSCPPIPAYLPYDIPLVPQICTWVFIQQIDMPYMKQCQDSKDAILSLIGYKLPDNTLFRGQNKEIFLQLMWEVFRFSRDNGFTEMGISSLLGLFYFTHRYFLTTSWRTARETYEFFKEGLLLHSVLDPPKSIEVFTPTECKQSLDLFFKVYMRQLPLLRFVCLPNYRLIMTLERDTPQRGDEEK